MKVGIIGLGYVGLPLAVAFAEAGSEVVGLDVDSRTVAELNAGRSPVEDVDDATLAALAGRFAATTDAAELARLRRRPDLRPDAARQPARARPQLHPRRRPGARRDPARGPARRPRVDDLPGHDPRPAAADPRGVGPHRRRAVPPRLLAGADRPRPHRLHDPQHAEGRRRPHRRLLGARRRPLRADLRAGRRRLDPRGRRADEAAREHLPLGQHRARQRARDPQRPDGDRHLGGRRRRGDEAVRVHALRAGPGDGRPLPARSTRSTSRSRRASTTSRPSSSSSPARSTSSSRTSASSAIGRALNDVAQAGARVADPDPRRLLQGRDRRHPRVAGAADHRAAARARRRGLLPRPARRRRSPSSGSSRCRSTRRSASADVACVLTAHPELDYAAVVAGAQLVVDFRGVTRDIEATNLVRL